MTCKKCTKKTTESQSRKGNFRNFNVDANHGGAPQGDTKWDKLRARPE